MSGIIPWAADVLILGALLMLTIAVYGVFRMPDIYTRLHAASKTAVFGIIPLLLAITLTGDPAFIARAVLIGAFVLFTTPVAAHSIAWAAFDADKADLIEPVSLSARQAANDPGHPRE